MVGSRLIAQPFTKDEYFWPRPSAASYDASASSPSNLAASNYLLRDLVTTSGSGLDPNITLQNAEYQLDRVVGAWTKDTKQDEARVREQVNQILQADVIAPFYGLIGEKMVNVMEVNLELRKHFGAPPA
jgi:K+-transporting ATPase c subunit